MKTRPLGEHTDKAWLAGWDAGICGLPVNSNTYRRHAQAYAWERGRAAGLSSDDKAVAAMKRRVANNGDRT